MRIFICKTVFSALLLTSLLPLPLHADYSEVDKAKLTVFNDACVNKWMEGVGTHDAGHYKALGTHFCGCAGKQMLPLMNKADATKEETDAANQQVSGVCLTEAVLHHTVNTFSEKNNVTEQKLETGCLSTWQLLFSAEPTADQKQFQTAYCHCAAAPLAALSDEKDKLTDAQYADKLSTIAANCRK